MKLIRHTLAFVFTLVLMLCSLPALAVNYVFPGNLPAGCSGSGSSYTCPGGGGLAYNDTVTIASATPITVTITGNMSTNNARINQSGSASNLTIIVQGTLTAEYQAVINANVTVNSLNGSGSEVVFGGNITSSGTVSLGYRTTVAGNVSGTSLTTGSEVDLNGNVTTTTGGINLGSSTTVAGNMSSTSGSITLASTVQVDGTVSCSCALSVGHQARIVGNVSATSITSTSQSYFNANLTATGAVDLAYGSTVGGSITSGTTLRLRGNTVVPQCMQSTSSSTITLEWNDRANGGVCCGSLGSCTTSCVVNNSGAAMPAVCSGGSTTPARFNAFDTTTASGITGNIKTKVSGTAFSVAIVAVNTAGTAVATTFTGNVRVEVLNTADNSGALNSTTNCRSSWSVASGTSSTTLNFAASDSGRKNVSLTVAEAFTNARIRVSYPDTGTPTVTGCSTDNFAIRPASFGSFSVTDATSSTAGTTRSLTSVASPLSTDVSGNFVHKAGRPFTVRATAANSSGTTTALYTGTPTATLAHCSTPSSACGGTLGTLTYAPTTSSGVVSTTSASYSEAGAFTLQLVDSSFAAVDASDGSTAAERNITSGTLTVGRFVPDRFGITVTTTPSFRTFGSTCASRSFTYYGQSFGYAVLPRANVTALNAAGAATLNYPSTKFSALQPSTGYVTTPTSLGLTNTGAMSTLTASYLGNAVADIQITASTEALSIARSATTPQSPLLASAYAIDTTWSLTDTSETSGGIATNESITGSSTFSDMAFDAGGEFRYGQLKLGSAYGSELIPLAAPLETQYWNGTSFVTNTADHCTALPTSGLSLANFRGSLAACETAPTASSLSFASGRATMRLAAPGNGNKGSVDGTVQLGATITAGAVRCSAVGAATSAAVAANLPWLQSKAPGGTNYDQNPSARFSFGQYRSPLIQLREMY